MNIFILDEDPRTAASMHCDKHVPKMVLESAQMLSTAHRLIDGTMYKAPSKSGKTMVKHWKHDDPGMEKLLYKAVHMGHPCTLWSMESDANYNWHYKHFIALCDEYTYRYGKTHLTDTKLREALELTPYNIHKGPQTPFRLAMADFPECHFQDPVVSYRAFYQTKQKRFSMVWSKRDIPSWFNSDLNVA